jgi:hypothetical protein
VNKFAFGLIAPANDEDLARPLSPCERMCEAILWRALKDVVGPGSVEARRDAVAWLNEGSDEVGGFGWIATTLKLSPDFIVRCGYQAGEQTGVCSLTHRIKLCPKLNELP